MRRIFTKIIRKKNILALKPVPFNIFTDFPRDKFVKMIHKTTYFFYPYIKSMKKKDEYNLIESAISLWETNIQHRLRQRIKDSKDEKQRIETIQDYTESFSVEQADHIEMTWRAAQEFKKILSYDWTRLLNIFCPAALRGGPIPENLPSIVQISSKEQFEDAATKLLRILQNISLDDFSDGAAVYSRHYHIPDQDTLPLNAVKDILKQWQTQAYFQVIIEYRLELKPNFYAENNILEHAQISEHERDHYLLRPVINQFIDHVMKEKSIQKNDK